jgi:hypothetical protein
VFPCVGYMTAIVQCKPGPDDLICLPNRAGRRILVRPSTLGAPSRYDDRRPNTAGKEILPHHPGMR